MIYAKPLFTILTMSAIFAQDLKVKNKCQADIVIAGLFAMKTRSFDFKQNKNLTKVIKEYEAVKLSKECNGYLSAKGLQEAWAMLFAVDQINNNMHRNVNLGVHIEDTCDSVEIAIQSSMKFDFVTRKNKDIFEEYESTGKNTDFVVHKKLNASEKEKFSTNIEARMALNSAAKTVAVIGMRKSMVSKSIATLTNLFNIPAISYGSTDSSLSDKTVYPSFIRTIPSDILLAKMLITLVRKLKWNILFAVYDSSTDYGKSAFETFQKQLEIENLHKKKFERICLADIIEFKSIEDTKNVKFKNTLLSQPIVKGVLLFVHSETASTIISRVIHENIEEYTWIFTEGIELTERNRQLLKTKLTKTNVIYCEPINTNFFKSNLFLEYKNFLEVHFFNPQAHQIIPITKQCINENCMEPAKKKKQEIEHSFFIPYVIDAVNLVAHALEKRYSCAQECSDNRRSLVNEIQNTTFDSALGYKFEFDKDGHILGQYEIFKIEQEAKVKRQRIGVWNSKFAEKISAEGQWNFSNSSCSSKCLLGWGKIPTSTQDCCSNCIKCKEDEFINSEEYCKPCPPFYIPTTNFSTCIRILEKILSLNEKISITLIIIATAGQILVILIVVTYIKYRYTHMIRASGKEMSYLILLGNFLSFTSPYCVIEQPMEIACVLNIIVSGLALSLIVGPLAVKTHRVYSIFTKDVLYKGISKFVTTKWQRIIVLSIVLVQCSGSLATALKKDSPLYLAHFEKETEPYLYIECSYNTSILTFNWVLQSLLIVICTYQAILARNVPANYNEARSIMLCMITMAIEWIVVLPSMHFGGIYLFKKIMLPVISIMSATSTLLFIFIPRVYIVLFRPSKNKENLPHGKLGKITPKESQESNTSIRESDEPCFKKLKLSIDD
ncbi:extracellular calcium-sensing receptor isoform X1 [Hydra vulgaris]|uniref:extracellular calcium-sensing receptor isoform X1 n=1 Tax=Hydra vulgaris TaxID=6087 RepID=UPI001F5E3952|nr:extracellular calcium-sensing receptor isoform X1 [Hydra vulgaris]